MPESWSSRRRPSQAARSGGLTVALALLLSACTEPMFQEERVTLDGGALRDAGPTAARPDGCVGSACPGDDDFEVDLPSARLLPRWAKELPGQYAMRVRYYGHEEARERSSQMIALATIEVVAMTQDVKLTIDLCEFTSEVQDPASQGPAQRMSLLHPEYDPPRVYTITFPHTEQPVWQATNRGTRVGYAESVFGCTPNAMIDRPAFQQRWLGAPQCKCPTDPKLPTALDDCRLTDPDVDREPGVALLLEGPVSGIDHVVRHDASEFVFGTIDPKDRRLRAKLKVVEEMAALQCGGRTCEKPSPVTYCYQDFNEAKFERLETISPSPDYDCADLLSDIKAGKLLVEPEPAKFPSGC